MSLRLTGASAGGSSQYVLCAYISDIGFIWYYVYLNPKSSSCAIRKDDCMAIGSSGVVVDERRNIFCINFQSHNIIEC